VTMAHIHNGAVGVAGPVVVTLFAPGTPTGTINGVLVSGSLTSTNLPSGVTLESLKALLLSGNAYINVHTVANPGGEIRGQLK
ncbi:MAG TPA: CHRD domain-containing protein, partial [Gemmatimonadaceae bacterium]|nr:CHRD domain-containing protein [Gemmatimonadaceae bacterium]